MLADIFNNNAIVILNRCSKKKYTASTYAIYLSLKQLSKYTLLIPTLFMLT
jgi:hypothetical protein